MIKRGRDQKDLVNMVRSTWHLLVSLSLSHWEVRSGWDGVAFYFQKKLLAARHIYVGAYFKPFPKMVSILQKNNLKNSMSARKICGQISGQQLCRKGPTAASAWSLARSGLRTLGTPTPRQTPTCSHRTVCFGCWRDMTHDLSQNTKAQVALVEFKGPKCNKLKVRKKNHWTKSRCGFNERTIEEVTLKATYQSLSHITIFLDHHIWIQMSHHSLALTGINGIKWLPQTRQKPMDKQRLSVFISQKLGFNMLSPGH